MHISLVGKSGQRTISLSQTNPSLKKSIEAPPGFDDSVAFVSNASTREGAMHTDHFPACLVILNRQILERVNLVGSFQSGLQSSP